MLAKQEDDRRRDGLGRIVREVWIAWAKEQPAPKPSWLVPYDQLNEPDKEVDRRIGERLAREGAKEVQKGLRACAKDRLELIEGVVQALSMVREHYDEFCDEEVPEMTNGSPLHQSLTNLRGHLEGTLIGSDGEYMPRDKYAPFLSAWEERALLNKLDAARAGLSTPKP